MHLIYGFFPRTKLLGNRRKVIVCLLMVSTYTQDYTVVITIEYLWVPPPGPRILHEIQLNLVLNGVGWGAGTP